MAVDVLQVDRERLPVLLFPGVRQRDVQAAPVAWAGEPLKEARFDHAVDEPCQPALAEEQGARQPSHRETLARCHAKLGERIEPGQWQPTGGFQLAIEDGFYGL